jgi:hypothetical protein
VNAPAYCNARAMPVIGKCCSAEEIDVSAQATVKSRAYGYFSLDNIHFST